MATNIRLDVIGLTSGQTQGSYTLILGENGGRRKLAIIIGSFEAQAIAIEIEKIVPFRPMTHDVFVNFANAFEIRVREVMIYKLVEGVFYAKLICEDSVGKVNEIDLRTSDAIAIAVRMKCPIFTTEEIMITAGHEFNIEESEPDDDELIEQHAQTIDDFSAIGQDELNSMLDDSIRDEEYQRAALIREEMNRRK